ncbi:MAG: M24 family metallopeptidase [Phycisphaerales bacterium]|nr:M24 family metallopeptidase [Phycisphaerales bacterium]
MKTIHAGIPASNNTLYRAIRFLVGDPAALIIDDDGTRTLIIRDIEMGRAREHARADVVHCPGDFTPEGGLSGDRETATAQALAEALRRADVASVRADRTLAMSFVHELQQAGVEIVYDPDLGVLDRRVKDAEEVQHLRAAQARTQLAIEKACRTIAACTADADGVLQLQGEPVTSERVRALIDADLLQAGFDNPTSIVAGGPQGADCHDHGHGPLRTGEPIIIDVFPRSKTTRYNGDCTRCVVHGDIPDVVVSMHAAVLAAKAAAEAATRPGVTGEDVHAATSGEILAHGFEMGLPDDNSPDDRIAMVHGTGHGIGLDVHEPPLLDAGAPALLQGDVLTIEPGLYGARVGGIRVEDMVLVTADGCEDLGIGLHMGLNWA